VKQTHDISLNLFTLPTQELASTIFFQTFQSSDVGSVDKLVDSLNELFVHLLDLKLLLRPVVRVGRYIYTMNILVVFDQSFYRFRRELECDLVPEHHIDMDDISFDVKELIVEQGLDQRILIFT